MIVFSRCISCCVCVLFSTHLFALDISKNLTVNFATEANYYPFEYLDEQQQIQGFDIDIARAVCESANLNCVFHNQSFDSLLLTLQFGRFDAVIAALDITEARKTKVDFSDSYYKYAPVFVSPIEVKDEFSIIDKFIGVQTDSSNHHYLLKHAKKSSFIISYPSFSQAFNALSLGKIDFVFADQAVVADLLRKEEYKAKFSVKKTESMFIEGYSSGYGIAVKKGNRKLTERLNFGLKKIVEEGTYNRIFSRYFNY